MRNRKFIRLMILMLCMILNIANLGSSSPEQTLTIKAYKNAEPSQNSFMGVYITDAITSALDVVAQNVNSGNVSGSDIDITEYVKSPLLGDIDNPTVSEENIIFSYRVVGNYSPADYTISLAIGAFEEQEVDNPTLINAYYKIVNENAVWQTTSKNTYSEKEGWATTTWTISLQGGTKEAFSNGNKSADLQASWNVDDDRWLSNPFPKHDIWIVRGAVATVIDSEEYEAAPNGTYKAVCKVVVQYER